MTGVEVIGANELLAALGGLADDLADSSEVFGEVIDREIVPAVREQFDTEGRGRWPKLSPHHAKRKRALYGDRPILQASGELHRGLTTPGGAGQVREIGPGEATFGTTNPVAGYHHNPRRGSRTPPRKLIEPTDELREKVARRATGKTRERAARRGFKVEGG